MNTLEFSFSASSVKDYLHCGLKFKYNKIDRIKPEKESSHHRWLGRVVHNSIYESLAQFDASGERKVWKLKSQSPNYAAALNLFDAAWDGSSDNEYYQLILTQEMGTKPLVFRQNKKLKALNTENQEELHDAWRTVSEEMVKNGMNVLSKIHKILELEKGLSILIEGRKFTGFIDVIGMNEEGKIEFYDFKTSWDRVSPNKLNVDIQFLIYSIALREIFQLDYYPTGYLVHLRTGALVEFEMLDENLKGFITKMKKTFEMLESDMFFDDFGGNLCSYCDFYNLCYPGEANG